LANDSPALSSSIIQSLQPLFAKETNDSLLIAMIEAFCAHARVAIQHATTLDNKTMKLITSGLVDKLVKIKTAWIIATSEIVWKSDEPASPDAPIISFSMAIAKPLFAIVNEVSTNAVQSTQSGTIVGGYAAIAASLGKWMLWKNAEQLGISMSLSERF
jgi:hypothetical protein